MSTAGIGKGEQQYWTFQKYFILVTKLAKVLITQKTQKNLGALENPELWE